MDPFHNFPFTPSSLPSAFHFSLQLLLPQTIDPPILLSLHANFLLIYNAIFALHLVPSLAFLPFLLGFCSTTPEPAPPLAPRHEPGSQQPGHFSYIENKLIHEFNEFHFLSSGPEPRVSHPPPMKKMWKERSF